MRLKLAGAALLALGTLAGTVGTAEARGGCGPGFHRGFYGYCRPNLGPRWGYGWRSHGWHRHAFYGGPRWGHGWRHHGWHRAGWRGGWHRGGGWHHRW